MFSKAKLRGLGCYLPEKILASAELESRLELEAGFIESRTGVMERRIAAEGETVSTMAVRAGKAALADAGLGAGDLDLVLVASSMPDMFFPASACLVQSSLGASCAAFDINCACSGFLLALGTAAAWVEAGVHKNVLVIGSETTSRFLNWSDYKTCILFGDGAGAAMVSNEGPHRILSTWGGSDGSGAEALKLEGGGSRKPQSEAVLGAREHFLFMDGGAVFRFAKKALGDALIEASRLAGINVAELNAVTPHQSNIRIIQEAAAIIGIPQERFFTNIADRGNTAAASVPIALTEAREAGFFQAGDKVGLVSYGSGLASASAVLEW